ncbi:MAG TPA: hypothetical protein ACFYD3_00535 [Candidatus Hypogeohydataceae bacterium YC41]
MEERKEALALLERACQPGAYSQEKDLEETLKAIEAIMSHLSKNQDPLRCSVPACLARQTCELNLHATQKEAHKTLESLLNYFSRQKKGCNE